MRYDILCAPSYSLLEVQLEPGEKVVAEAGAMAWMSDTVRTETSTRGGLFGGLKRALLSGESFFQNTYRAEGARGVVGLAPGSPGDIVVHPLQGELDGVCGGWESDRNDRGAEIKWRFNIAAARIKLRKLYPSIQN